MITTDEAEALHNAPKIIFEDFIWEYDGSKYHGSVRVECRDRDDILRLVGWVNDRRYSYSLIYRNAITIRRWGDHPGHRNPDGELVEGPHKHRYEEEYEDGWAYNVNDVSTSDARQAFFDFLDEESIELASSATYQGRMGEYND